MLSFVDVYMPDVYNDFGMFTIAYAIELCLGEQPGSVIFDQQLMREYLYTCM